MDQRQSSSFYPLLISAGLFLSTALASQWLQKQATAKQEHKKSRRRHRQQKATDEKDTFHGREQSKRNNNTNHAHGYGSSSSFTFSSGDDKQHDDEYDYGAEELLLYHNNRSNVSSSCTASNSSSSYRRKQRRRRRRQKQLRQQQLQRKQLLQQQQQHLQEDRQRSQQQAEEHSFVSHYKSRRLSNRLSWDSNLNSLPEIYAEQHEERQHQLSPETSMKPTLVADSRSEHRLENRVESLLRPVVLPSEESKVTLATTNIRKNNKHINNNKTFRKRGEDDEDDFRPKNSNWNHFERINETDVAKGVLPSTVPQRISEKYNDEELSLSSDEQFVWTEARYHDHLEEQELSPKGNTFANTDANHPPLREWKNRKLGKEHLQHNNKKNSGNPTIENSNFGAVNNEDHNRKKPIRRITSMPVLSLPVKPMLRRFNSAMSEGSFGGDTEDDNNNLENTTHSQRVITRAQYNATIMPCKVVLVRHGQSMGNVDEASYSTTPDNAMPLTKLGWEQARAAGKQLKEQILISNENTSSRPSSPISPSSSSTSRGTSAKPTTSNVHFIVSPYVRTVETFHAMVSAWCDPDEEFGHIKDPDLRRKAWYGRLLELGLTWHEDPRIREQDFGNYQDPATIQQAKKDRLRFGVFYYRFPHGESASDVYDRVSTFLDSLWRSFDMNRARNYVLVTHGISIRVLLARYFRYTINQFNMLSNPKNCEMILLGHDGYGKLQLAGRYELLQKTVPKVVKKTAMNKNRKKKTKRKVDTKRNTPIESKVLPKSSAALATAPVLVSESSMPSKTSGVAPTPIGKRAKLAASKSKSEPIVVKKCKSFSCASDYDSDEDKNGRIRRKMRATLGVRSRRADDNATLPPLPAVVLEAAEAVVATAAADNVADNLKNSRVSNDNVDDGHDEGKDEGDDNNVSERTASTATTSPVHTDSSSCTTVSVEASEASEEAESEEKVEIKEYVFHKRLRVVPQKYIQKAPIRISYED